MRLRKTLWMPAFLSAFPVLAALSPDFWAISTICSKAYCLETTVRKCGGGRPGGDRLGKQNLLLHAVSDEVVDELQVVSAVYVHARLAVTAAVSGIIARADVAGVYRTGDVEIPRATAAADPLGSPVPCALYTALPAVLGV